jgi:hypothetical protein
VPIRDLPLDPDLNQLRDEPESLRRDARGGDPRALSRLRECHIAAGEMSRSREIRAIFTMRSSEPFLCLEDGEEYGCDTDHDHG